MTGFLLLMAIGAAAYWLTHLRRGGGSDEVPSQVDQLREQVRQLRDAQWEMRSAIDRMREEQDFANRLAEGPGEK